MKVLAVCLLVLLAALQFRLWFGSGSVQEVWRLREQSRATHAELVRTRGRNDALEAEVRDLKSGLAAIEERARTDLGMLDEDETFYRFVREKDPDAPPEPAQANPILAVPEGGKPVQENNRAPSLHDLDEPTGGGAFVRTEPRDGDG